MRWIACDVETTGLIPGVHEVWEVALVTEDGRTHRWLIEDLNVKSADPSALEVGGWWDRWDSVASVDKEPASVVAREVSRMTAGRVLVGINPAFDAQFLSGLLRRHNRPSGWHYGVVDVKALAAGWLHGYATGIEALDYQDPRAGDRSGTDLPWRTEDLARACGVALPTSEERHTAAGDARFAWRWYRHLTGAADTTTDEAQAVGS